jgi:putative membrane protein
LTGGIGALRLALSASKAQPCANMEHTSLAQDIVRVLLTGVSVIIVSKLLPGMTVRSYGSALFFAFVVGVLNAIAWHFLAPLTVTFSVLTLGLGALVINAILFMIADAVVEGVELSGFFTAMFASLGVTLVNWVMHLFFGKWAP